MSLRFSSVSQLGLLVWAQHNADKDSTASCCLSLCTKPWVEIAFENRKKCSCFPSPPRGSTGFALGQLMCWTFVSFQSLRCVAVSLLLSEKGLLSMHVEGEMSFSSCYCTGVLLPLPHTAKGPVGVRGCLQLRDTFIILSYLEQRTAYASVRMAFTSLSSEDWSPSYSQSIFDE